MANDLNNITVEGGLVKDPDVRETPGGVSVCDLYLATNQQRGGRRVTTLIKATLWSHHAEFWGNSLRKSDRVMVIGAIADDNFALPLEQDASGTAPGSGRTTGRLKVDYVSQIRLMRRGSTSEDE
jgi:single-stranded DNA-binding protein